MNQIKTGAGGEVYSNPEADELSKHYGIDAADELTTEMVKRPKTYKVEEVWTPKTQK